MRNNFLLRLKDHITHVYFRNSRGELEGKCDLERLRIQLAALCSRKIRSRCFASCTRRCSQGAVKKVTIVLLYIYVGHYIEWHLAPGACSQGAVKKVIIVLSYIYVGHYIEWHHQGDLNSDALIFGFTFKSFLNIACIYTMGPCKKLFEMVLRYSWWYIVCICTMGRVKSLIMFLDI